MTDCLVHEVGAPARSDRLLPALPPGNASKDRWQQAPRGSSGRLVVGEDPRELVVR